MSVNDSLSYIAGMLGLFIAAPLLHLWRQRFANIFLGIFLIAFSMLSFASVWWYFSKAYLFGSLDWALGVIGPSIYLYVRSVCGDGFSKQQWWHFLPAVLLFLYFLAIRFVPDLRNFFGFVLGGFQFFSLVYAIATLVRLTAYKTELMNNFSSTKGRDLNWLIWLSLTLIILLIIWIPASLTFAGGVWSWGLVVGRFVVLGIVGWWGIRQKMVFLPEGETTNGDPKEEKYKRSGMTESMQSKIRDMLEKCMLHQKYYLQNDLKLSDLAQDIDTSPQLLSEYFNQHEGKTFFQYVNELRVAEAKKLLSEDTQTSVIDIAFSSGFNSKSTFNSAFKNLAGVSPSQWRKNQLN